MAIYDYTKEIDVSKLRKEILESGIVTSLKGVTLRDGDNLTIDFVSSLSAGDETTLNNLIAAHVANPPLPTSEHVRCVELSFAGDKSPYITVKKTTYVTVARFIFQGSTRVGLIDAVNVALDVDSGATATMRLYDHTNGNEMGVLTDITNTDLQVVNIEPIVDVPEGTSILELQVKVDDKKKKARVHCLTIDFADE